MTDITRVASDHLLHSTPEVYDINAEFKRDMEQHRADVAARVVARLDQEVIIRAVHEEIAERMTLTADDIADMQARCDEQKIDRDCNARMCN